MKIRRGAALATSLLLVAALLVLSFIPTWRESLVSALARRFPQTRDLLATPSTPIEQRLREKGFALGQAVLLRIFKEEGELEVWLRSSDRYALFAIYPICKWSGALGPKLREGDGQSPEGYYFASTKQLLPNSRYHRAINTGFPNAYDKHHGRTGSVLMIHGSCVSIGCFAMTDAGIDDIYKLVEAALLQGSEQIEMHLYPFRLNEENFTRHAASPWAPFWKNLAEGDVLFQQSKQPLQVFNCNGVYGFNTAAGSCEPVMAWP
jgi:murein L,D-transpeptidase YafK